MGVVSYYIHRFQGLGRGILGTCFRINVCHTVLVIIKWYLQVSFSHLWLPFPLCFSFYIRLYKIAKNENVLSLP